MSTKRLGLLVLIAGLGFSAGSALAASVTLSWNPVTTNSDQSPITNLSGYRLFYSTNSLLTETTSQAMTDPSVAKMTTSSVTLSTTTSGLSSGTTYNFRLTAYNTSSVQSGFNVDDDGGPVQLTTTTAGGSSTPPINAAASTVYITSAAYSWNANGNPAGTQYLAEISSNNFASVLASSQTANVSAEFAGLNANTSYYFQVQVANPASSFDVAPTTSTLADAPSALAVIKVNISSFTLSWNSNGNPSGTVYQVNYWQVSGSTQSFDVSAATANVTALSTGTVYYASVAAVNNDGILAADNQVISTATLNEYEPPTSAGASAVYITSAAYSWNANGNPTGTQYLAEISSNNFASVLASSQTANVSAEFAGLNANTSYYFQVQVANPASSFDVAPTTSTLAAAPVALGFSQINYSSFTVVWGADGNPAGTSYKVNYWQATGSTQSLTVSATTAAVTSLSSGATYYVSVAAVNNDGILAPDNQVVSAELQGQAVAAPSVVQSAVTNTSSGHSNVIAMTLSAQPAVGNLLLVFLSNNADSTNFAPDSSWTQIDQDPTQTVTYSAFSHIVTSTDGLTYNFTGSSASGVATGIIYEVSGADANLPVGAHSYVTTSRTATSLATPSLTPAAIGSLPIAYFCPGGTSITYTNPSPWVQDRYSSLMSAQSTHEPGVDSLSVVQETATLSAASGYAGHVGLVLISPAGTVAVSTTPADAAASAVYITSAAYSWNANGNPAGTQYLAEISSNNFASVLASSQTANVSAKFAGLNANTTYYFQVQALNPNSPFAVAPATSTLADAPTALAFSQVNVSSFTLSWSGNGNPNGTSYQLDYWPAGGSTQTVTTALTTAAVTSMASGTTYYASVAAVNNDGILAPDNQVVSTMTDREPPLNPTVTSVLQNSVAYSWESNGNPNGTSYLAEISSNDFASVLASSQTTSLAITMAGLNGNTTYYFQVQALNPNSPFASAPITSTLASAPTALAFIQVNVSSFTLSWSGNGNPSGTSFQLDYWPAGGSTQTVTTALTTATVTGVTSGITYYASVAAVSNDGILEWDNQSASTMTLVNYEPPTNAVASAVYIASATYGWSANGDPAGTSYLAEISSNNFASVLASSQTENVSAEFAGLNANTSYYFKVQVANPPSSFAVAPTTSTLAAAPVSLAFTQVNVSSASLSWGANSNPSGTNFVLDYWTAAGSTQTVTVDATSATLSGLSAGTTYYASVAAINNDGILAPDNQVVSAVTQVVLQPHQTPSNPAATLVFESSMTYGWGANGNPAGTSYLAEISSNNFGSVLASSQTQSLLASFAGLGVNTTYYFQVQALNPNSPFASAPATSTLANAPITLAFIQVNISSFTLSWSSNGNPYGATSYRLGYWLAGGSTQTVDTLQTSVTVTSATPGATYFAQVAAVNSDGVLSLDNQIVSATLQTEPSHYIPLNPMATSVSQNSAAYGWGANGNPAGTSYLAEISSDNFADVFASSQTQSLSASFAGLGVNTTYYFQVQALNPNSPFASAPATSTLANAPITLAFTQVNVSSFSLSWNANGNPDWTSYQLDYWQAGGSTQTVTTAQTTLTVSGAASGVTYYASVAAVNNDGILAPDNQVVSTTTLIVHESPSDVVVSAVYVTSMTYGWNANGNPVGTQYLAEISSNNFASVLASSQTENISVEFASLNVNTTYYFQVQSLNPNSPFASAPVTSTLANEPAALGFIQVNVSSIAVSWNANGNPAWTSYQVDYWQAAGSTQSLAVNATTATLTSLLSGVTYYVSVAAANGGGVLAWDSQIISAKTHRPNSVIALVTSTGVTIMAQGAAGPEMLEIPAGEYQQDIQVTLQSPESLPNAPTVSGNLTGTGAGLEVDLSPNIEPSGSVMINMSYQNVDLGTINPSDLVIARYDPIDNVWVPLPSTVNTSQQNIMAVSDHLCTFQIEVMNAPTSVGGFQAYPNPMRPALGETLMTFQAPANSRLRIYTLTGELVKDIGVDPNGMASWDGTNRSGQPVASGVYFIFVQGAGQERTFKVAVER